MMPAVALAAEAFPTKSIRLIAPFSAGGGADTVARLVSAKLSEELGQQVIVDNRPGASNIIGTELTARAAPDGYTIMIVNVVHAINAGLRKLPYDPINDFSPISLVASTPFILVVHPSLPVKSVRDLIALAKAKPGQINYASSGSGSGAHLAMEMFRIAADINIVHVPYKGISGALRATVSGETQAIIASPITALAQAKAGRLRALAVTGTVRSKAFPDIPTMSEAGVPGYDFTSWYGLLAPRGVPTGIIARLNQATAQAVESADVVSKLEQQGAEPVHTTPAEFAAYIKKQIDKYTALVRKIGLSVK
jgi:tripartite-type tricarboxylate transporter receptor subunit TctC